MPKLAANLSMLFPELAFLDRFAAARKQGFTGVEIQFPYEIDKVEIAARLHAQNLALVLFNTAPGDLRKGETGLAALPSRVDDFRRSFELTLAYAQALACPRLHFMAGVVPTDADAIAYRSCFCRNLVWAASFAAEVKLDLLLEPLNPADVPGYLIPTIPSALSIIDELRLPNLFLQFDAYHTQMNQGSLARSLRTHVGLIRHIQISGVPGRHEPDDSQEINYSYLLPLIDELGYDGWVGCEYNPRGDTAEGLAWAWPWLRPQRHSAKA
ncbi:MAG TPA: 2-oxo-tetronate isomerase [Aestuariivirgaceae bacterium]|jgi:hydroxypyruvate isomerase